VSWGSETAIGVQFGQRMERVGGLILIGIGLRVVLAHLT
jgi:putative Mn2+ efflux pump MntP